jgi:hypothetical protein
MVEWGELSFKVVRLEQQGQEVLARAGNFLVAQAAFDTSVSLWPMGLSARPYFHRYKEDATDLCDVLSAFSPNAKASLHELCRVMRLPGKPNGIDGSQVEKYYREGRIQERLPITVKATF